MSIDIEDVFLRCEIPDWKTRKDKILEEIKTVGSIYGLRVTNDSHFRNNVTEGISETSFYTMGQMDKPGGYGETVIRTIQNFFETMSNYGIGADFNGNVWHQVYERGDMHGWHVHPGCNMSTVFYVKLPDENSGTEFSLMSGKHRPKVKEGEFLSFPATFVHRSPLHESDETKIIMSFNWNMTRGPESLYER